jgi:hypothetical protein
MAKIKAFTNIQQSKKLAKILPPESADMYYEPSTGYCTKPSEPRFGNIKSAHPRSIRCWSLAALIGILPKGTNINSPSTINARYCCWNNYAAIDSINPVDACYEMILKLNELKQL